MPNTNFAQNIPDWEAGGYHLFQPFEQVYASAQNLGQNIMDFNSPLYQNYRSYMGSMTPTMGVNSWLSPLMAGGGNYMASQRQAQIGQKNYLGQRNDFLNTGTKGFASQNLQMLPNLLNIMTNAAQIPRQIKSQEGIASNQMGSPWQMLSSLGGMLPFLPGLFSSGAPMAMAAMSDIRAKENISYTGEETKDGIPIAKFNFKGNDQRYKGVIAQDVEKIRPDAVTEINGIKHVYYGRL